MFLLENLNRDDYLVLVNNGYNAIHTFRSFKSQAEFSLQLAWRNYVYYECDNILCKYTWPVYKQDALTNKNRFITLLKCPACKGYLVTGRWTYYITPPIEQLNGGNYFLYDVILDETNFIGNINDNKQFNSRFYSSIYHIHKQY